MVVGEVAIDKHWNSMHLICWRFAFFSFRWTNEIVPLWIDGTEPGNSCMPTPMALHHPRGRLSPYMGVKIDP